MQIVWFKRDLRVSDHAALMLAAQQGQVLPLYILEPELWQQGDLSYRHYLFLKDCLYELNSTLTTLGVPLIVRVGDAVSVLESLRKELDVKGLWSHQETWNGWTFERDKRVKNWALQADIPWHEPTQNGVIRRLSDRDGWAKRWYQTMSKPCYATPSALVGRHVKNDTLPTAESLGLAEDGCEQRQLGGMHHAQQLLDSFLHQRGMRYTKEMSSPVTAFDSCSRLSPHLAFGTVSIREVFQAVEFRMANIKHEAYGTKSLWRSAMRSFSGRLRWHCHFMQKLEDEPHIEFENMHSAYNDLRDPDSNQSYLEAWKTGHTGFPMIDACMRALIATGWINFRMRAMLMSFASYQLWLDWRAPALHLARLFTDYEPGIHYSQVQMQSGTTGINSIRIYNPIKQGIDQDPNGDFIRQWIPELGNMPTQYIHQPWTRPSLMNGYPRPIVDEATARKAAASQLYPLRKATYHRQEVEKIVKKHASRKQSAAKRKAKAETKVALTQGELLF